MDMPRWVEPVRELQARVDAMQIMVSVLLARLALRVGDPEGMLDSIVGAANTAAAQVDPSWHPWGDGSEGSTSPRPRRKAKSTPCKAKPRTMAGLWAGRGLEGAGGLRFQARPPEPIGQRE
jgi:hypothetical protein